MGDTARILAGRYRLLRPAGRGGMSEVHVARDEVLGRDVAVKLVTVTADGHGDELDRLEREARAIASLSHPNVVTVHDAVREGDQAAIVMELLPDGTLADRIASESPMPWRDALAVAVQVAGGLHAAHRRGIVHRDVKPSNVLLAPGGQVKVADFGIAGRADATTTTTVRGSLSYLAPEQARGERPDPRTDVYALGCLLYEMLTGRPPFTADTSAAVLGQHLHRAPDSPSTVASGVPPDVDALLLRMLAKDPDDRPVDMEAVRAALDRLLGDPDVDPAATVALVAPDREHRSTRRPVLAAVAVAGLALVGLVGWALQPDEPRRTAAPTPSPMVTITESPTTAPTATPAEPTSAPVGQPTTDPPDRPATVEDAGAAFRRLLAEGRAAGEVSVKAEEELDKLVTEILAKDREDKPEDVAKQTRELVKKIDEYAEKGEISADRAGVLRDAARDIRGAR